MRAKNYKEPQKSKTIVETYVIEETSELIYDDDKLSKWNDLVNELGLTGQTKIIKPEKSPIPFLPLNIVLINTFQTLCPRHLPVDQYDVTPIPLDILELIALSIKEKYFHKIEIWYDEKSPDPVCVGIVNQFGQNYWASDKIADLDYKYFDTKEEALSVGIKEKNITESLKNIYIIGKWADVSRSFDELRKMASERYILEKTNEYQIQIDYYTEQLNKVRKEAAGKFNTDSNSNLF